MYVQEYLIHIVNGDVIPVTEACNREEGETLLERFEKAKPYTLFCAGDAISGYAVVPARSIAYITVGDLRESDGTVFRFSFGSAALGSAGPEKKRKARSCAREKS